jgi:opacity protein-like surface antigen
MPIVRLRRAFLQMLCFGAVASALGAASAQAAETPVKVGEPLARFALLKPGVHRYVRYKIEGDKRTLIDLWVRRISFEPKDGRTLMRISQRWDEVNVKPGATKTLEQDSWFEPSTFRPLTHIRRATKDDDKVVVAGYRFLPDKVEGLADLPDNSRKDFSLAYAEPAYNFELDMEFLQALPLADGYAANIVFYDAGIDPKADHYVFKVAGSDRIVGWDGRPVDCWVVTADYNTGKVRSRFWFDKKSQVLIREEAPLDSGGTLVKTLLPPEAGDTV